MLDSTIHWINHYPLDNSIGFASVYLGESDLSGGQRYPSVEQLGPDVQTRVEQKAYLFIIHNFHYLLLEIFHKNLR